MSIVNLLPPCSYQGGKQRLAVQILDIIEEKNSNFVLYDLCCGSGSISLESINRGHNVIMIDKGLFGLFWENIGKELFDIHKLEKAIEDLPSIDKIGNYLRESSNKPVDIEGMIYDYLLFQAGAFGSKQIWIKDNKWCNNTFRNYWLPTTTSNRKSPVNPMMPMPNTLLKRVDNILTYGAKYIKGYNIDIQDSIDLIKQDKREKIIYIDPPYIGTTGYFDTFDIYEIIKQLENETLYISEGLALVGNKNFIVLSEGRKKGNVSGIVKKDSVMEILNVF